jgi:hypothetical protein
MGQARRVQAISAPQLAQRRSAPGHHPPKIWRYQSTDLTDALQELACLAGVCEVDG